MADATGETKEPPLRVTFDRRIKLEFHGARITSDGGLLAYRELDDVFDLTAMGASALGEGRRGRNIRHHLPGLLRQAVYSRLAGYEDVNDAERLAPDPVMRAIVGREGMDRPAASTSQMGRFETEWLASEANLAALTALSGAWIERVHVRRPPDGIILDMDSSESPTHGQQEGSAWNGHFGCTCYHPRSCGSWRGGSGTGGSALGCSPWPTPWTGWAGGRRRGPRAWTGRRCGTGSTATTPRASRACATGRAARGAAVPPGRGPAGGAQGAGAPRSEAGAGRLRGLARPRSARPGRASLRGWLQRDRDAPAAARARPLLAEGAAGPPRGRRQGPGRLQKSLPALMREAAARHPEAKRVELWFEDGWTRRVQPDRAEGARHPRLVPAGPAPARAARAAFRLRPAGPRGLPERGAGGGLAEVSTGAM